ncbi:MAG: transporter [bacterium]
MAIQRILWTLLILCCFANGTSWAMHASLGAGSGHDGPITTIPGTTPPKGTFAVDINTEYFSYHTFTDRELIAFAQNDKEIHNVDYLLSYAVGMSYGILDNLTVHARLPYVLRNDIYESEPPDEIHAHGDSRGLGDASIHLHHRIINESESNFSSSLLFGLKMPTGKTSDKDNDGNKFEAEFQPGSGSWDPSFGLAATKGFGHLSLDTNISYTLVTEGTQNTDLGDAFAYNLALAYPVLRNGARLAVILEANGIYRQKEEIDGVKDVNSGGNTIFLAPGFRFSLDNRFSAYASLGFPIVEDLNGDQNETNYRTVFGINVVF